MARLFAEVSHAAGGTKKESAAEIVAKLYDLQTLRPTAEHQALYDKLKEELIVLGVPLA